MRVSLDTIVDGHPRDEQTCELFRRARVCTFVDVTRGPVAAFDLNHQRSTTSPGRGRGCLRGAPAYLFPGPMPGGVPMSLPLPLLSRVSQEDVTFLLTPRARHVSI